MSWPVQFSHQTYIGEPAKHARGSSGLFALFEFLKTFANDYPSHYIIHPPHDCPSQMNSNSIISVTKLTRYHR